MANFIELGERTEQPSAETSAAFSEGLGNLSHTAELGRTLEAAQQVAKTLATLRRNAPENTPDLEGVVIHVAPDLVTGTLTQGEYRKPDAAFGPGHGIAKPKEAYVEGGHYAGQTFEGDSLVVSGSQMIVVNGETGMGCHVPEPPEKHLLISPA